MNNKFNIGEFIYTVDYDRKLIEKVEIIRIFITKNGIYYDVIAPSVDFGHYEKRINEINTAKTIDECLELAKEYLLNQLKEFKIRD